MRDTARQQLLCRDQPATSVITTRVLVTLATTSIHPLTRVGVVRLDFNRQRTQLQAVTVAPSNNIPLGIPRWDGDGVFIQLLRMPPDSIRPTFLEAVNQWVPWAEVGEDTLRDTADTLNQRLL